MNVFVAGASGAIGRPLVTELIRRGHVVTGMTRSVAGEEFLRKLGAGAVRVSAFDSSAVERALTETSAEIVIDELTALPKTPADMAEFAEGDRRLRLEGGGNLLAAACRCGVRRYIQQGSGFFLKPGPEPGDEEEALATEASPRVAASARTYSELERRLLATPNIEGVVLRYGFYYGPGTWYHPEGAAGEMVRQGKIPIIDDGQGVWSWVHIDDAAVATADALTIPPGIYHIVDDDPVPVSTWLPAFTRVAKASSPPVLSATEAFQRAGEDAVYYGTRLRGASNAKAKRVFGFRPRPLEWLMN
jgi:nucleoside-diphosphate-sugar epimerase